MVSKLAVGVIVVIMVVGAGAGAYLLTRPKAAETYELFFDYQVGRYYVYETTTTMDNTTELSTHTMQVTAVEDDEITAKYISTVENIGLPQYAYTIESADVTMIVTMTKKGEMTS